LTLALLKVTGHGNTSEVAVKLHTKRNEKEEIERGLQKTLDNIVRLVEERGTKAA
jgi:hypothetical protein